MPVGGPTVGVLHPGNQSGQTWAGIRPKPKSAVDMYPCPSRLRDRAQCRKIVARADVEVARVENEDRRRIRCFRKRRAQRFWCHQTGPAAAQRHDAIAT